MSTIAVTHTAKPAVEPRLYIDLDIVLDGWAGPLTIDQPADIGFRKSLAAYPGVAAECIVEHGPAGGNPIYRVEGPIRQLIKWLQDEYGCDQPEGESSAFFLAEAKLAR